jgi:GST-like protein
MTRFMTKRMLKMIDLYYTPSPNGHKITLFLEEAQLQYRLIHVDISKGSQFHPDFLQISPNNKIPAIIDHAPVDGGRPISLFESGEILLYLAEKSGKLLSGELRERHTTLQWLFWQVSGLGLCWGRIIISVITLRKRSLTPLKDTRLKPSACTT